MTVAATDYADVRELYGEGSEVFTDEDIDTVLSIARRHCPYKDERLVAARLLLRMALTLADYTPSGTVI